MHADGRVPRVRLLCLRLVQPGPNHQYARRACSEPTSLVTCKAVAFSALPQLTLTQATLGHGARSAGGPSKMSSSDMRVQDAHPARWPLSSASTTASVSQMLPRALFTRYDPRFILPITSLLNMPLQRQMPCGQRMSLAVSPHNSNHGKQPTHTPE